MHVITQISGFLLAGFNRRSLGALALLLGTAAGVGYRWSDLVDANGQMDWLLSGIWLCLATLVCWRVRPRQDLLLVLTGLAGGAVIETWGTQTGLWTYFTAERPPLWILPAWPIAALGIERLAVALGRLCLDSRPSEAGVSRTCVLAYWGACAVFTPWMWWFMRPAWGSIGTQAVMLTMVIVVVSGRDRRHDVALFAAGTLLGLFLEYWGTSRQCWTYHTGEVPPPVAVPAHGFAALAFARAGSMLGRKLQQM